MGWMRYKRLYAASPLKKKGSKHGYSLPRGNGGRESEAETGPLFRAFLEFSK